jgi:hypothetical protein
LTKRLLNGPSFDRVSIVFYVLLTVAVFALLGVIQKGSER